MSNHLDTTALSDLGDITRLSKQLLRDLVWIADLLYDPIAPNGTERVTTSVVSRPTESVALGVTNRAVRRRHRDAERAIAQARNNIYEALAHINAIHRVVEDATQHDIEVDSTPQKISKGEIRRLEAARERRTARGDL